MKTPTHYSTRVHLETVLIAFFILAALSLLVVHLADPSIYAQALSLTSSPADRYPVPVTLFLVGILAMSPCSSLGLCTIGAGSSGSCCLPLLVSPSRSQSPSCRLLICCPLLILSGTGQEMPFQPSGIVHFPKEMCSQCPLKAQCTASAKGRSVSIHPDEALLIELWVRNKLLKGVPDFVSG